MTNNPYLSLVVLSPLARIGRLTFGTVGYLGKMAALVVASARAVARPEGDPPPFRPAVARQVAWMLGMGLPLVALVHVGMGSFLSMQAYFGGTFVDGTGAVVGVGLIRNIAPLMTGLTLAGLIGARTTAELRAAARERLDDPTGWIADRADRSGSVLEEHGGSRPARLVAVRLTAALIAGPVLTLWAIAIGTVVGWQVAEGLLGVSTHAFFHMFLDMLWLRDVVGVIVKGLSFSFFAAAFACHEGLRGPAEPDPISTAHAACRAACLACVAILTINSAYFLLLYHAGPAFGPTLLSR